MRVGTRLHGEDGISAIVASIALFGVMTALLLSLDAGNLWGTRRAVITATDATALEQARLAALQGPAASCTGWENTLRANAGPETVPLDCSVVPGATDQTGYVMVDARKPSAVRFGGIYGKSGTTAFSSSSARWGFLSSFSGLRPIALCVQNEHVRGYLGTGPDTGYDPSPGIHRVYFTKSNPAQCGNRAPGNWGYIDFDGDSNSNADLVYWLLYGYDPEVTVGDCDSESPGRQPCDGDTGSSGGSVAQALSTLVQKEQAFAIILFDSVVGNGANADYNIYAFLGVILRGYKVTGPESERYFDFEFTRIVLSGTCCVLTGIDTGVRGVRLCAVDHDPYTQETRCLS